MKTLIWKDTCTLTFIAALFIRAKTGKVPNCPSTDEWIKKMWGTHPQIHVKGAQSCPTLCDPMDYTVHGILQASILGSLSLLQGIFSTQGSNPGLPHWRIIYQLRHQGSPRTLEWVPYPCSCGSSWPRNRTSVSCIASGFFTNWAIREVLLIPKP